MSEVTRKLRLLVLTSTYPRWRNDPEPGFVHELAKRLTDRFDVTVLGPHASGAAPREIMDGVNILRYRYAPVRYETLVNDGGIVGNLKKSPWKLLLVPGFLLAQWIAYQRILRTYRPDVIHAHWLIPQGLISTFATPKVATQALVVTSHGADLFAIQGKVFAWLRRNVLARAAAVTVVSQAMRQRVHQENGNAVAVHVMPMGVDLDARFTPSPSVSRSAQQLLFVGRLVEKKGCINLIEAMPKLLEAFPNIQLIVVGSGPERERLTQRAGELGITDSIEFRGAVSQLQLPHLYRQSTVLVAPFIEAENGDQEGLGLVVAEAIGCHCPVIVGDVAAVHDLVDSTNCSIVRQRNVEALTAAIIDVINNPVRAQERAAQALQKIKARISWTIVANGYADLFASVANKIQ